jgi:hypothetical protein
MKLWRNCNKRVNNTTNLKLKKMVIGKLENMEMMPIAILNFSGI